MDHREHWRRGFRLSRGEALAIRNTRRAAIERREEAFAHRLRALLLLGEETLTQAEVAKVFEVTPNCVTRWVMAYGRGGVDALRTRKAPGAPRRLGEQQRLRLKRIIELGPEAYGLDTGVWTAPIVGQIIRDRYSIRYSATQVRRILHDLGFSLQYPKRILSEAQLA